MKIIYRPSRAFVEKAPASAVTIGNFDGVHLGHRAVLQRLLSVARERDLVPTVVSFAPSPKVYFAQQRGVALPRQILPLRDKLMRLRDAGIEQVVLLPFDDKLSRMPAPEFVHEVLRDTLHTRFLMVGDDFRFGAARQGDFSLLSQMQKACGFQLEHLHTVDDEGVRISSTMIREHLVQNDLNGAQRLLGHPITLTGHVMYGRQLGRSIGIPTINLKMPEHLASQGIYVVTVDFPSLGLQQVRGVASIGIRPSVHSNGQCWCEVNLFDFNQSVYGQMAHVTLQHKIRDEARFEHLDDLIAAIRHDIVLAHEYFAQSAR